VGGSAQIKAMKKIAGPLRVELAQYRELAAFAQFGSDLSKDTQDRLRHGERIVEILKQPQYKPMPVEEQVLLLYALTRRHFGNVAVADMEQVEGEYITYITEKHDDILRAIRETKDISKELEEKIKSATEAFMQEKEQG
jgi:F-type H+-transporting ATPase subunit alpha